MSTSEPGLCGGGGRGEKVAAHVERSLKKLPVEPASYETDGAAIAKVLRRWYGDEAPAVAAAALRRLCPKPPAPGYPEFKVTT